MTGVTTVSVGFWARAPMAYRTAAARHSRTPVVLAVSTADSSRVLREMSTTPEAAMAMPISSGQREALLEQDAGEQRDEDGADGDDEGRRAGVDLLLTGVEGDVVRAEPGDAGEQEQQETDARSAGDAATAWPAR